MHTALKVDAIGPEIILFAGASEHLSARKFTGWGSEGVKGELNYTTAGIKGRWCLARLEIVRSPDEGRWLFVTGTELVPPERPSR